MIQCTNNNFKGIACRCANGTNLNFEYGSIQEWGCIQANKVLVLNTFIIRNLRDGKKQYFG